MRAWSSTTPCSSGSVVVGAPGLGDHDRRQRGAEAGAEHDQPLAQRVRHDRPAEVGVGVAEQLEELERHLRVLGGRRDPHRVVVVDAVEVERLADGRQVAVLHDVLEQRLRCRPGSGPAASARGTCRSTGRRRAWRRRRRPRRRWPARWGRGCWRSRRSGAAADGLAQRDRARGRGPAAGGGPPAARRSSSAWPGACMPIAVADQRHHVGLVDRHPVRDPVAVAVTDDRGVLGEARRRSPRLSQPPSSSSACGRSQW